jgi:hypothetical protein
MATADRVTGLARSYGQIFFDQFGLKEERFSFIPTGIDEAYLPQPKSDKRANYLLHVGEIMPDQSSYSFYILEKILAAAKSEAFDKLVVVGLREVNEPRLLRLTEGLPRLRARIEFIDHCPQTEVYDLIARARACLLVPGVTRYWWNNFAKMVDYIAIGAPVIAHVPPISEARHELTKAGTAFFLEGDSVADAKGLGKWLPGSAALRCSAYAERYTANRLVKDFAVIFRDLQSFSSGGAI